MARVWPLDFQPEFQQLSAPLPKLLHIASYYLTLLLFAAGGLGLNVLCLAGYLLPRNDGWQRFFQRRVHACFRTFIAWMRLIGVCRVECDPGLYVLPRGLIIAANHPGLMDVTYLLACIPEAVCFFKPAIRRNPVLGAAAVRAGYIPNSGGVDAVRGACDRLQTGNSVVIFPEGTRTPPGMALGPLRAGFALIAARSGAAIQLVRIRCDSNALTKSHVWWKPPSLPIRVRVELGPRWTVAQGEAPAEITRAAEKWWRDELVATSQLP